MTVIRAAVQVTRPGGEVPIKAGMGGSMAKRITQWFDFSASDRCAVAGSEARVDSESHGDLLVLRVLS